jgi:hypothetical protein
MTITFVDDCLYTVSSSAAEQIYAVPVIRVKVEIIFYYRNQAVDASPKVSIILELE